MSRRATWLILASALLIGVSVYLASDDSVRTDPRIAQEILIDDYHNLRAAERAGREQHPYYLGPAQVLLLRADRRLLDQSGRLTIDGQVVTTVRILLKGSQFEVLWPSQSDTCEVSSRTVSRVAGDGRLGILFTPKSSAVLALGVKLPNPPPADFRMSWFSVLKSEANRADWRQ